MSTLTQFLGGGPTTSVVNYFSSGGVRSGTSIAASAGNGAKEELGGAMATPGTLTTLLTVTGRGSVPYLAAYAKDTTMRSIRMEVTIDGVVVFDATSDVASGLGTGIMAAGCASSSVGQMGASLEFTSSLVVKVASSRAESGTGNDRLAIAYLINKR